MTDRNENRPGYKKTKVGWIPEEWGVKTLNCISDFITKGATPTTYGFSWVPKETGIPFIRSECVSTSGIIETKLSYISLEAHYSLRRSEVNPGDILIAITGHVGRVICFPPEIPLANINQHIARVRIDKQNINKDYVFHYLNMKSSQTHFQRIVTGQAYPQISLKQVREKLIPLPPTPEQKKIAEILSTWDEAIKQTRKLIEAKKRRKKALMQRLLTGKKRLPGFTEVWTSRKLGNLFRERIERNCESLELLAITRDHGVVPASTLNRKDSSNSDKSKYKRIAFGDIGYNTMRMWQGVSARSKQEGIISPAYTVCVPNAAILGEFAALFFKFHPVVYTFWRYSQGLVNDTLNLKFHNFSQIHLKIPDIEEQYAIADIISFADSEIKTLDEKLSALIKQKRGLMQKLLTGEIRVITKYILDTCIFNWLLNGRISHNDLPQDAHFVITHLQIDEINKTNDKDLRSRLQLILTKLTHEVVPTETLVFNISRWDNAKWSDGSLYTKLVSELNELSNRHENNIRDSLIAEVAIQNGYGLLTADRNLAKVARKNGCNVRFYTNTEKSDR